MVCITVKDARTVLLVCSSFNLCALCGMSYYKKSGCASRQEGVSLIFGSCRAPDWVGASGDEETLLPLEYPAHRAREGCWHAGKDETCNTMEVLGGWRKGRRCLLAAQGSPRPSPRADCKEETFLEMQRWLCTVCSIQEATGEELDRKTQWERLPHPTESAREGTGFCAKRRGRVAFNIFVR